MSEHKDLYLIRWTGTDGQESLVAITDNLDKWLEYNNKSFKSEVLKLFRQLGYNVKVEEK